MPAPATHPGIPLQVCLRFISFFSKDSREVNLNYFKLAKADIFDSVVGEAIFKKKMLASK